MVDKTCSGSTSGLKLSNCETISNDPVKKSYSTIKWVLHVIFVCIIFALLPSLIDQKASGRFLNQSEV